MKKGYQVEIIPNLSEKDNREGLRILARIIARKFLVEHNETQIGSVLEDNKDEEHVRDIRSVSIGIPQGKRHAP